MIVVVEKKSYGFWKFVSNLEHEETMRYLNMFYHLQFRPMAQGSFFNE